MLPDRLMPVLWLFVFAHVVFTWLFAGRRGRRARPDAASRVPAPVAELPPVSVIVPAWNERGTIERNIRALQAVDYPDWEVIVLAGGSDGTYEAVCQVAAGDARISVIERTPDPKNAALNRGVQLAHHEVLVFLDADSIVEPGWLRALIAPLTNGASASVGERLAEKPGWISTREDLWNNYAYRVLRVPIFQGDRSIAIRRSVLSQVGGLPLHAYAREDWDLWLRLTAAAEPIAFADGARVVAERPATLSEYWADQVRWRRTLLSGLWEHRGYFLSRGRSLAFANLYLYLVSAGLVLGAVLGLVLAWMLPQAAAVLGNLLALFLAWFFLRLPATAIELASFTGDRIWLKRWWVPIFTALVELPASVVAILSLRKQTAFYKGARHNPAEICIE